MKKPTLVAVALLVGVAVAGCTSSASDTAASPTGGSATTQPSSPATPSGSPSAAPSKPVVGPSVPPNATPVPAISRPGEVAPDARISAPSAPLTKPVTYRDGLQVRILSTAQSTITAVGPGALTGKPMTTFKIEFTNRTTKPVDLNQVVVSARYGKGLEPAQPVYVDGLNDFAGTVAPGKTAATSYAFSIPVADLGLVTLGVDFDGKHTVAVFTGSTTR